MILYSHTLYERLASWLRVFERSIPHREQAEDDARGPALNPDVIVFGLGRYGSRVAAGLREEGCAVLGVDFDPEVVAQCHAQGWPAHYGDAEDPELPASLRLSRARWIVSAIPVSQINLTLMQALRAHGYVGRLALTAHTIREADLLKRSGADVVLLPFADAAERAVELLTPLRHSVVESSEEA